MFLNATRTIEIFRLAHSKKLTPRVTESTHSDLVLLNFSGKSSFIQNELRVRIRDPCRFFWRIKKGDNFIHVSIFKREIVSILRFSIDPVSRKELAIHFKEGPWMLDLVFTHWRMYNLNLQLTEIFESIEKPCTTPWSRKFAAAWLYTGRELLVW